MRRIGLIGGLSWLSSLEYYRQLNALASLNLGPGHAANVCLINVDLVEYDELLYGGNETQAEELLHAAARDAVRAGAELLAICSNGAHVFFDSIEASVDVTMLHIADAVAAEIVKNNIDSVGLLGVRRTMEDDFYRTRLADSGVKAIIPDHADREYLHESILSELVQDRFEAGTRRAYVEIIEKLAEKGAHGVVLACTEIPLLINQSHVRTKLFGSLEIHSRALFHLANEDSV